MDHVTNEPMSQLPEHSKISFTAKLVAYGRRYSDIPYATDVAQILDAESLLKDLSKNSGIDWHELEPLAPMVEARYKSLNEAVHREGITQILEFASGVTLRGLIMARDPNITYVETDLPGMNSEKLNLVAKLRSRHHLPAYHNLHYHSVNVLNWNEIEPTLKHFSPDKPIAIIHEGLMQYLTVDEKNMAATHIQRILSRFGGIWATPDFSTRTGNHKFFYDAAMKKLAQTIIEATKRDFAVTAFEDDFAIENFLRSNGFTVEVRPQIDGSFSLSSAEKLNVPQKSLAEMQEHLCIWVMRSLHKKAE